MGQGFSMTTLSAAVVSIDIPELSDLVHDKTLASARFMKSIRARNSNGFVFVKAVQKPYAQFDIRPHVKQVTEERNALAEVHNAMGYQKIIEIGDTAFLIRQYMFSSVYDRLSTRPFLEDIERKWLAFQLLCAVRDSHARNIYHGDIKSENLLVTSWNWLFLTDYSAAFKPTTLPEDNPADFFFYFDTSGRRICYIAPERFTNRTTEDAPTELNWAMDMFSVGCTIAELFLEGPIFTLSQIFKYRTDEYSPKHTHIDKIEDEEIRAMILNMIELDPEKRYSAEQHLSFYKGKIFPDYFYGFLHQYMQVLTEPAPEHQPVSLAAGVIGESDDKIDKIYSDFDRLSYFLGSTKSSGNVSTPRRLRSTSNRSSKPGTVGTARPNEENEDNDGTLLFLTVISSSLRSTSKASARLKACDLLVAFANRLPDEAKLDRILPYAAGLLNDRSDIVKVAALNAVTAILDSIEVVSPINAYLFPEYILPKLKSFLPGPNSQPSALVRAAYASCLASLALSSARMLDMVQAIRADGRIPALSSDEWAPDASFHGLYDVARAELVPHFEEATTALITDSETSVRRALLTSVSRLCIFFGSTRSSDLILSHLNTYLNDKDWMLRCSFLEALVGIALYVGSASLEKFILPIMVGSLTDPEFFVVERIFRSFARMAALGILHKHTIWELTSIAVRYFIHPSIWIREAAVQFVVQSSGYLSQSDRYCIMLPLVQPFLRAPILELTQEKVLDHLKSPLSKSVFEAALLWASRRDKSLFWTAASRDGVFVIADGTVPVVPSHTPRRIPARIPPSQRDKDDQNSLETLRNLGMVPDDEVKLLALREYLLRVALHKTDDGQSETYQLMNNIVPLTQIGVTPQNVFFDQREPVREVRRSQPKKKSGGPDGQHTLADALLDASTTINDTMAKGSSTSRNGSIALTPPRSLPLETLGNGHTSASEQSDGQDRPGSRTKGLVDSDGRSRSATRRQSTRDNDRLSALRDNSDLRRRGSAINLLGKADTNKAGAELSTNPEYAFGRLDAQTKKRASGDPSAMTLTKSTQEDRARSSLSRASSITAYEPNHSYTGTDENVLKLLDNHFAENFPIDLLDFGQSRPSADTVTPIKRVSDPVPTGKTDGGSDAGAFHKEPWRPSGQLLTQFAEHTAAISRVVAAPDHAFFVTASDDGSCKVWDTIRLEKNVNPRSKYTHRHSQGARVKSLCFVEGTHTFLSGADDGSIHALRVDYRSVDGGENTRYGKPVLVRDYQIPRRNTMNPDNSQSTEYAVWLYHYRTQTSQSVLVVATNHSRILLIDLKNMEILYVLDNPIEHGALTTFVVDRRHHWLLVGTTNGILDLWDLRFKLRLRSIGLGGLGEGKRVDRLFIHPSKGHGRWVIVSCGGELSVWDIEKLACREVYRPSTLILPQDGSGKGYEIWAPDHEPSEKLLERFAKDMQLESTRIDPDLKPSRDSRSGEQQGQKQSPSATPSSPLAIPAITVLIDYLANPAQPSNPNKTAILFTGGFDRTIRYWDLSRPDQSCIISGPLINTVGDDTAKERNRIRYESSWPMSMSLSGLVQLVEEKVGVRDSATPSGTPRKTRDRKSQGPDTNSSNGQPSSNANNSHGANGTSKAHRSSIISAAQQQLLRTHMDGITDLIVLKKPYGCVVSVDRMGNVMVFH